MSEERPAAVPEDVERRLGATSRAPSSVTHSTTP